VQRPDKPARTIRRARQLRRTMSLPEVLLWCELRKVPGLHFRKQHGAGGYVLDFFCARANLAIEVDGFAHDTGDRPARDIVRDAWLARHRIDTLRIAAREVLADPGRVAEGIVALALDRLDRFGKLAPPSRLRRATYPSQVDGEEQQYRFSQSTRDGAVVARSADREVF
jgi:very-short-patch-repair endonuclease